MRINALKLQNFRNHKSKSFTFKNTCIIIGKNTAGKTNILEAINILARGKSFRAENDRDTINESHDFLKIEGEIEDVGDKTKLVAIFANQNARFAKKFLVNNVARRQADFASNFYTVLFTPEDIEIITDSPSLRRKYFDSVLYSSDKKYRVALSSYEKALRQRNRMLYDMKNGKRTYRREDFGFWEEKLIGEGEIITNHREEFVEFINNAKKDIFNFKIFYDKSVISLERIFKYHFQEQGAGMTLVGPQRDDFLFLFPNGKKISEFGSRGEQRLAILQTKILEIEFLKSKTEVNPVLLLDDIFSELDDSNIHKVFEYIKNQQTIITTTHREFVPKEILKQKDLEIIEL